MDQIPGIQITPDQLNKRPAFDMMLLPDSGAMQKFMAAVEGFVERVRAR